MVGSDKQTDVTGATRFRYGPFKGETFAKIAGSQDTIHKEWIVRLQKKSTRKRAAYQTIFINWLNGELGSDDRSKKPCEKNVNTIP